MGLFMGLSDDSMNRIDYKFDDNYNISCDDIYDSNLLLENNKDLLLSFVKGIFGDDFEVVDINIYSMDLYDVVFKTELYMLYKDIIKNIKFDCSEIYRIDIHDDSGGYSSYYLYIGKY